MKRSFVVSAALALVLLSCGPKEQGLPPEEVMQRAAQKSLDLLSARFTVDADFTAKSGVSPVEGTLKLTGVLQDAGKTVQCTVSLDANVTPQGADEEPYRLLGGAEFILTGQKEVYVRFNSLETQPDRQLFQKNLVSLLLGKWWLIPSQKQELPRAPGGTITPSPSLLKAQSQVVRITRDDGFSTLSGRKAYHYQVAVDRDKLLEFLEQVALAQNDPFDKAETEKALEKLTAQGEMWIDAETFFLMKARWSVSALSGISGGLILNGTFTIILSDMNNAPPVNLPKDAEPLLPGTIFSGGVSEDGGLSPEQLEKLRKLEEVESSSRKSLSP